MNIDQWMNCLSEAFECLGKALTYNKKPLILTELSESSAREQIDLAYEAMDIMTRFFFKKAAKGETFGSPVRIEEEIGRSIEEHYGLIAGPFIDMARTYWTYRIEVEDLLPDHQGKAIAQILLQVKNNIACLFFPTPDPIQVPVEQRREDQRHILQEFAPEMDIERFLAESPILKED